MGICCPSGTKTENEEIKPIQTLKVPQPERKIPEIKLRLEAFGLPKDEYGDNPTTQCKLWYMNDAQGDENFITKS